MSPINVILVMAFFGFLAKAKHCTHCTLFFIDHRLLTDFKLKKQNNITWNLNKTNRK